MTTRGDDASARSTSSPAVSVLSPPDLAAKRTTARWVPVIYLLMSVFLLIWVGVLVRTLPDRAVSHNYRLAWVGFDVLLMLTTSRTAWLAWRRSPFVVNVASATAALLVVDAWFDVTTSSNRQVLEAFALALLVELPLAVLSLVIAGRAQVQIATTGALPPPSKLTQVWRRRQPREPSVPAAGVPPEPS